MKNTRGFNLMELMIAAGISSIITIAIIFLISGSGLAFSKEAATNSAKTWAGELGLDVKGISCVNMDTDGDGYVSCTILDTDGKTHSIECSGVMSMNDGCRTPKQRSYLSF